MNFEYLGRQAALALLGLVKVAAPLGGAAAFKQMVRAGGPQIVESAAVNPFRALAKGAVPHVERGGASIFERGFAQARPVPGFGQAGLTAPTQAAFEQLGGRLSPEAIATGALQPGGALASASRAAPVNPLKQRLQSALARPSAPL